MGKRAIIEVEDNFIGFKLELEKQLEHAMGRGMSHIVAAARATPTRYHLDPIKHQIGVSPPKQGKGRKGGLVATVIVRDFRGLFFESGTLARRSKKLKKTTLARRQTPSGAARYEKVAGRQGVKAQHLLGRGLRLGWPGYQDEIRKALPK
jgi:hypothetical protein